MGLVLISLEKLVVEKSLRLGFSTTNNEAKYKALLEGMSMVQRMGGKSATMFSDSRLVVGQVKGELEVRDERMQEYLTRIKHLQRSLNRSICNTSLEVEIPMLTPWSHWQPPQLKIYLVLF